MIHCHGRCAAKQAVEARAAVGNVGAGRRSPRHTVMRPHSHAPTQPCAPHSHAPTPMLAHLRDSSRSNILLSRSMHSKLIMPQSCAIRGLSCQGAVACVCCCQTWVGWGGWDGVEDWGVR